MGKPAADKSKTAGSVTDDPPGMAAPELKVELRRAKDGPLTAAFALSADNQAILRVHRRRPPRALERDMKEAAPDSRNHRHGTVSIDPEQPKLLRFQINKAASGMARRLIVALKGTGFNKVEIVSDDGAPPERHEDPETDAPADDPASAPAKGPSPGPLVTRLTELVRRMNERIQADPSQKPTLQTAAKLAQASLQRANQSTAPDDLVSAQVAIDQFGAALENASAPASGAASAQAIAARLTELAKQAMPGIRADPSLKDHLGKAHAALKSGALDDATTHADALEQALAEGASQALPGAKVFFDLAKRWRDAEQSAQADLDKLKSALDDLYDGDPAAAQMEQDFQIHLHTVLGKFDGTFAAILHKASTAKSDADLRKLKNDLIRNSVEMITFLGHDTIALIDSNPFVDTNIAGRCAGVLKDLRAALN